MKTTQHIRVGDTIGRWLVLSGPHIEKRFAARSVNYVIRFNCRCSCGTERAVRASKLVRNSRSCGCLKREEFRSQVTTHGNTRNLGKTRLYRIWHAMKSRCSNPSNDTYHLYGGRGISVCEGWKQFVPFAKWAGENGYLPELQIDRVDGNKGYEPSNCRWVTSAVQQRNKRTTRFLVAFGETKCLTDWALDPRCTVTPSTLRHRLTNLGLTPEQAITRPRRSRKASGRFKGNHVKKED